MPRVVLHFLLTGDQARAGTTGQQRDARMNAENFQNLLRVGKKSGRHEHEPERHLRRAQLPAQILRPLPQSGFIEITRPVGGD